jgi:hypothetical protein
MRRRRDGEDQAAASGHGAGRRGMAEPPSRIGLPSVADLGDLSLEELRALVAKLTALEAVAVTRLRSVLRPPSPDPDRLLRAEEVAALISRSSSWLRKHGNTLPGFTQPTGHRGRKWWSERALRDWMAKGCPKVAE